MSRIPRVLASVLMMVVLILLVACSGTATAANGTPALTTAPTATPKPKPTGVPKITAALCQQLMTVAEANQTMKPASPATTIRVDSTTQGGSCNYEYSRFHTVVSVLFLPYQSAASLDTIATQSLAEFKNDQGAKVTKTTVSGVGDQALYIAASDSSSGITLNFYALDTTVGSLYISCFNTTIGSPPATPQQPPLTQVCQQVLSRL
jgi:hypothetical protein